MGDWDVGGRAWRDERTGVRAAFFLKVPSCHPKLESQPEGPISYQPIRQVKFSPLHPFAVKKIMRCLFRATPGNPIENAAPLTMHPAMTVTVTMNMTAHSPSSVVPLTKQTAKHHSPSSSVPLIMQCTHRAEAQACCPCNAPQLIAIALQCSAVQCSATQHHTGRNRGRRTGRSTTMTDKQTDRQVNSQEHSGS